MPTASVNSRLNGVALAEGGDGGTRGGLDQAPGSAARQAGVAVEGDHEAHVGQSFGFTDVHHSQGLRVGAEDQVVELLQFAALALPPDVFLLRLAPLSPPVRKEEPSAR